ncbi:hypothetical protein [Acuticoccus mangrovi]|uniref:Uncharacterized protein n=1 Tax=Acuticoccus mangrovi TaxID=2796142 RepID=A0A934ITD0_9HYPH|nr:hypothetical protein [Acuticoccus mangrovi]MBJ3777832.1 hypothetical protein [Acuticoccus mangrovi]
MRRVRWLLSLPFRLLGGLLLLGGFVVGIIDLYHSVAAERLVFTSLGEIWYGLSPGTLNLLQAGIQRHLDPRLWDPGVQTYLTLPGWLGLFILATLILLVAQLIYRPR